MEFRELLEKVRNKRAEFDADTIWTETGDVIAAIVEQVEENRQALAKIELSRFPLPIEAEIVEGEAIEVIELPAAAQGESPEEAANRAFGNIPPNLWFREGAECYD